MSVTIWTAAQSWPIEGVSAADGNSTQLRPLYTKLILQTFEKVHPKLIVSAQFSGFRESSCKGCIKFAKHG